MRITGKASIQWCADGKRGCRLHKKIQSAQLLKLCCWFFFLILAQHLINFVGLLMETIITQQYKFHERTPSCDWSVVTACYNICSRAVGHAVRLSCLLLELSSARAVTCCCYWCYGVLVDDVYRGRCSCLKIATGFICQLRDFELSWILDSQYWNTSHQSNIVYYLTCRGQHAVAERKEELCERWWN